MAKNKPIVRKAKPFPKKPKSNKPTKKKKVGGGY